MLKTVLAAMSLVTLSALPCFAQDKPKDDAPRVKSKPPSGRKYSFALNVDAGNQQGWNQLIRSKKAQCVVLTRKGYVSVDLAQRVVKKTYKKLSEDFLKRYDEHACLVSAGLPVFRQLRGFLSQAGHGPRASMKIYLFFPRGTIQGFEAAVETACYNRFIPIKRVTAVSLRFRQGKIKVGPIQFREKGQKRKF